MSLKTLSPAFLLCASLLTPPLLAPALGATATPLHLFSAPALSPDGRTLATLDTLEQADSDETPVPSLVLRSLPDGKTMTIPMPCSDCIPSSPSWSPDGSHLAFIVRQKNTQNRQILRVGREGKNPETLLKFTGSLQDLRYGPRGGLAVLAIANARRDPGALQAGAPETGEIDAKEDEQRIAMVEKNGLHWQSPDGSMSMNMTGRAAPLRRLSARPQKEMATRIGGRPISRALRTGRRRYFIPMVCPNRSACLLWPLMEKLSASSPD